MALPETHPGLSCAPMSASTEQTGAGFFTSIRKEETCTSVSIQVGRFNSRKLHNARDGEGQKYL